MRSGRDVFPALLLLVGCLACSQAEPARPSPAQRVPAVIRVAAASDLTLAFADLGKRFEQQTGSKVSVSFGSSGLLAKQIREGAPFDMFASANTAFVNDLVAADACDGATQAPYARGHVVAWSKTGAVTPPEALTDLTDARFRRIAIANPEIAPYGKAAKQALEKLGLWTAIEPRVVYGENIRQTLQYAESGNAEVALVALSLALGQPAGSHVAVDEALHAPIDQALVVCKHGKNVAGGHAFADFVNSAAGRTVMRRFGLLLPGEQLGAR